MERREDSASFDELLGVEHYLPIPFASVNVLHSRCDAGPALVRGTQGAYG